MKRCVLLIAFLSLPLLGETIIGTVDKIDQDQLQIKSQDGIVTLHVDERTTVRKGKILNDLSALKVGDEVRTTCYGEGALTAANISARVTFSGVVAESTQVHIKVIPDSTNDVASTGKKTAVFVFIEPGARLGKNNNRLTVGQRVHVVGWDSGDGIVDADKVTILDTELPPRRTSTGFDSQRTSG